MSPAYTSSAALSDLTTLPKVTIVHPEHAPVSYLRASGAIDPGDVVVPTGEAHGKTFYEVGGKVQKVTAAVTGPTKGRYGVAMRQVEVMTDERGAHLTEGPVELVNKEIASGDFLRVLYEGTFLTTKVDPGDSPLTPGDLVTYDPAATRPEEMDGTGAWVATATLADALGEVVSFQEVGDSGYAEIRLLS